MKSFVKNSTCASLAKRYKARVRLRLGSSNANMDNPATEPASILIHHELQVINMVEQSSKKVIIKQFVSVCEALNLNELTH